MVDVPDNTIKINIDPIKEAMEQSQKVEEKPSYYGKKKVLIVDDNKLNVKVAKKREQNDTYII